MSKVILVSGATGNQGGAVVDAILASPDAAQYTILGVTRDANSKSAQKLASKSSNVKLVQGDFADMSSLFAKALKTSSEFSSDKIWGVFSVQVPMGKGQNVKTEERFGKELIDESIKAGVKHFVYTSVDRGGDEVSWTTPTTIPHFKSKHNIELHLREKAPASMAYTILRPTAFFDNFKPDFPTRVFLSAWRDTLGDKPLQLIGASDIGYVGGQAFLNRQQYDRKAIGLAGDSVNFEQLQATFKQSRGYDLNGTYGILGSALKWAVSDVGKMLDWFASDGYGVDIVELKKTYPKILDLRQWLDTKSSFEKRN